MKIAIYLIAWSLAFTCSFVKAADVYAFDKKIDATGAKVYFPFLEKGDQSVVITFVDPDDLSDYGRITLTPIADEDQFYELIKHFQHNLEEVVSEGKVTFSIKRSAVGIMTVFFHQDYPYILIYSGNSFYLKRLLKELGLTYQDKT